METIKMTTTGPTGGGRDAAAYTRATVTACTATSVTVRTGDRQRRVELALHYAGRDWSYLTALVRQGTQLNIVAPHDDGGRLGGEVIVVEPDYLVDVSSVAACFEPYGESHLHFMLNRLKPRAGSSAVLLGNFASQLLDEEVHGLSSSTTYAESIRRFFKRNGLAMAACPDLSPSFHADARLQRENIARAIRRDMGGVTAYRKGKAVVEPSFVCEMLGLQGRMDLLQDDCRVLVEQKSGKAAYAPGGDGGIHRQEKHYVQLLLYMAVLHYGFGLDYGEMNCFLLYSKYADGLLRMDADPALLHRAIRVRNAIAATEIAAAHGGAEQVLMGITADSLITNPAGEGLMRRFAGPRLEALLAPLHYASPLERAYYFRLYRFIATEHLLAKTGGAECGRAGFASTWQATLEEKSDAGDIALGMTLTIPESNGGEEGVTHIVLSFADGTSPESTNFRRGDTVMAYTYIIGKSPDARRTMVHRASIEHLGPSSMTLRLRAPQTDSQPFATTEGWAWAVEHDFLESSYTSLYRGLHTFLTATPGRRDLLLARRRPEVDEAATPPPTAATDYIAALVAKASRAKDCFVVIGPPGTGKTSFAMLNILKAQLGRPGTAVLLMAYTNRAVDEMCSKLVEAEPRPIDFIRLGSHLSCAEEFHPYLLSERLARAATVADVSALVGSTRVFAGTVAALNASPQLFELKRFDLAIIDEASQIPEAYLLGTLAARHGAGDAIARFVMIGDNKQLPAVVAQSPDASAVTDPMLRSIGLTDCRLSLFDRLLALYGDDGDIVSMLTRQGRMHEGVADFPNHAFYGGRLGIVPLPHQTGTEQPPASCTDSLHALIATRRLAFVAAPAPDDIAPTSKTNPVEAAMTAAAVCAARDISTAPDPARAIGVIVPFRNQIAAVRAAIDRLDPTLHDVTVDTVERYQGSQRDTIIYSTTVHTPAQLDFLTATTAADPSGTLIDRKLNVALTRARRHTIVIGNPALLSQAPVYAMLIGYAKGKNTYIDVPPADFCTGRFDLP